MNIKSDIIELIGNTPMLEIKRFEKNYGVKGRIVCKVEYTNPSASAKDRAALEMLLDAEKRGLITSGATIIEPTSGNTGIGIAMVAATRGYKAVIVMPDSMSVERRRLMAAFGAEVVLTPGAEGMDGSVKEASELAKQIPNSFVPGQFDNPANAAAHYKTTGPEIWRDTQGDVAAFISAVGTGGTITGVGKYLKEKDSSIRVIAVEPSASPLLSQGKAGPHKIQGIGANFVPKVLDRSIIDEIITISNEDAYKYSRQAALTEGLLVGISSGAALAAAVQVAARPEYEGKAVVVFLPDTGERYLTTEGYID